MYQVLARKWRPKNFHELVGQQHVTQALTYALDNNRIHHAYLFTGTRGVGKTTIARIFAKSLNCQMNGVSAEPCGQCDHCREIDEGRFPDLIEVDAASRTGVDDTRELLDNVPYAPVKGRYKVYLIDEVHMFSRSSFNALLKTLEEPPKHVKFILATTDPQKMPATVLSRCLQFHLKNMTVAQVNHHLQAILEHDGVLFDTDALRLLAEASAGSMRDGLSLLDQAIAFGQGTVRSDAVAQLLGAVPSQQLHAMLHALADGDAPTLRKVLHTLDEFAPDYQDLLKRLLYQLQLITIAQLGAERFGGEVSDEIRAVAARLPVELVQLWYHIATDGWQSLAYQPDTRMAVEMILLRMIALRPVLPTVDPAKLPEVPEAKKGEKGVETRLSDVLDTKQGGLIMPLASDGDGKPATDAVVSGVDDEVESNDVQQKENLIAPKQKTENETPPISKRMLPSDDEPPPWGTEVGEPQLASSTPEEPSLALNQSDNTAVSTSAVLEQVPVLRTEVINHFDDCKDNAEQWGKVVEALGMDGMVNTLLKNSAVVHWQAPTLTLGVDNMALKLADEDNVQKISAALTKYIKAPCVLVFVERDDLDTPTKLYDRIQTQDGERAKAAIAAHPLVQKLQSQLGAVIEPNSIISLKK